MTRNENKPNDDVIDTSRIRQQIRVGPVALRHAGPPLFAGCFLHGGPALETSWSHPILIKAMALLASEHQPKTSSHPPQKNGINVRTS